MSPLGNEDARAQVGTNGGLSQRWRISAGFLLRNDRQIMQIAQWEFCAKELDAAKLHIEEAVKALPTFYGRCSSDDVLKIIREIL